jgi:DNA-cytosine methyltransferase
MKYGSVCSGIEAASVAWHDLGWEPQWFSEIEQFPSEVLKHRFPDVPNLGDMTQLTQNPTFNERSIDLLVGGTPCQSFSVAGLRKGLADPRGNLMLTFLALADAKKPKWIVWENVPGVLSSNGGRDFACFLDSLEELGYICDVEILDAQFFGVAQRRRRVFVCGQSVDSILNQKTTLSGLTIAQCLTEILHAIWIDALCLLGQEPKNLDQASLSRDGVQRRMRLFGILTENCSYEMWRQLLIEVFQKSVPVQKYWDLPNGAKTEKEITLEDLLMGSSTEGQYILTEESLSKSLEDLYDLMKLYTTLTLTKETIQPKISMFFRIGEAIGRLILRLSGSSPNSLSATSSFLTLSQNLTNYARQTSRDIFSEMGGICEITNIIKQANNRDATFGYLGDWRVAAAVLFERESLQGNIKPSRKKREEAATYAQASVGESGDVSCVGGNLSPTVTSKWKTGYGGPSGSNETGNMVYAPTVIDRAAFNQGENAQYEPRIEEGETMSSLVAKGPHAVAQPIAFKVRGGCEGGGKGYLGQEEQAFTISATQDQQIAQPIAIQDVRPIEKAQNGRGWNDDGTSYTVDTKATQGVAQPIAFQLSGDRDNPSVSVSDTAFCIPANPMSDRSQAVAQPIAVDTYNYTTNDHTTQTIRSQSDTEHIGAVLQPIAVDVYNQKTTGDKFGVVREQHGTNMNAVLRSMAIRRLTPKECERLQGFPDDWTKIPYRNKPADQCPDGPRYKACGNSMAVPVMRWIGQRIEYVESLMKDL